MARRIGDIQFETIIKIVLCILIFIFTVGAVIIMTQKANDMESSIINQNTVFSGGECIHIETDDDDLSRDSENRFVVDTGEVWVREIRYLWLEFDWHKPGDGALIESWDATCHPDGPELFDAPIVFEEDNGWFEGSSDEDGDGNFYWNAQTEVVESNGYETEVECGHKIIVDIVVADRILAGTGADLYLCYYPKDS